MPAKDPEARREYMRKWRAKNREHHREQQRQYRLKNLEKRKEYEKRYYEKNRERILARESERYHSDPAVRERKAKQARKWMKENPELRRKQQRQSWAKNRYGLTLEELDAILKRGCALCGSHEHLHVDHCHTSGKVRAALCRTCNTGLGHFADDPARLRAAAEYLEGHSS